MIKRLVSTAGALVLAASLASACSSSVPARPGPAGPAGLVGDYHLIGDVGGATVNDDATVTLTLRTGGTLSVLAEQPGRKVPDTGSWQTADDRMTISFTEMKISGEGRYSFDGTTLRLPIKVLGDGAGDSTWRRDGPAPAPSGSGAAPQAKDRWKAWDLKTDASALGTKTYADAVAAGTDPAAALDKAAAAVRAMPNVKGVEFSDNKLNLGITYRDGSRAEVVTERLLSGGDTGGNTGADNLAAVELAPPRTTSTSSGCEMLPSQSGDPREPGREGVNPGGGYGVVNYSAASQPKPVVSFDSPPAGSRRALLVAPQYDVAHQFTPGAKYQTIRDATGDNIECIQASLKAAGYTVDTILGHYEDGRYTDVGDIAVNQMSRLLTANRYGVIYTLGHGHEDSLKRPALWMGEVNLDIGRIKDLLYHGRVTAENHEAIAAAYADIAGLAWDPDNQPVLLAPDHDGTPTIMLTPNYFAQVRAKGVDFSHTLLFVNGCGSALGSAYATASGAKAFLGWSWPMDGTFISRASEAIFDVAKDHARTIRGAAQLWQLHQKWADGAATPDPNHDPMSLAAIGENATRYPRITAQSHIFIFRMRHGPSSATSDITASSQLIRSCYTEKWASGTTAGLAAPQCRPMEYGAQVPTKDDVDDALFEVGATPANEPAGRWTLAD